MKQLSKEQIQASQGSTVEVANKKGKKVRAKVLKVNGAYADIEIAGKKYLINNKLEII